MSVGIHKYLSLSLFQDLTKEAYCMWMLVRSDIPRMRCAARNRQAYPGHITAPSRLKYEKAPLQFQHNPFRCLCEIINWNEY